MSNEAYIFTDKDGTGTFSSTPTGTGIKIKGGGIALDNTTPVAGQLTATTLSVGTGGIAVSAAASNSAGMLHVGKLGVRDDLGTGTSGGNQGSVVWMTNRLTNVADNTATDVWTVTVPNAAHAAAIKLYFLATTGSTDAMESSRYAEGSVVLARTAGADCVATAVAISDAAIATVSGGATLTLAYGVTAMTGASSATQTFTIQVTLDVSGNLGSNYITCLAMIINSETSGVTITEA